MQTRQPDLSAVDDTVAGGNRMVTVTASTAGLAFGASIITVLDDETAQLILTLDVGEISENGGIATATVSRNTQITTSLDVTFTSSDTTAATVPVSVTIPAGANSASFLVAAVNDSLADGTQVSALSAFAIGLQIGASQVAVVDDEIPELSLSIDKLSIVENGGVAVGTIRRNTPTTAALQVTLSLGTSLTVTLPASLTIPAGASSVDFNISAVDDSIASGDRQVILTAVATGLRSAVGTITVVEDDIARLFLTLGKTSISENGETTTATLTRNTPIDGLLDVSILSSDATAATAPASVIIPAGANSISFVVSAVNDSIADGDQTSLVIASSFGLLVFLASSDITEATVPVSVLIPAGDSDATFAVAGVMDGLVDGAQKSLIQSSTSGLASASFELTILDVDFRTWTNPLNPLDTDDVRQSARLIFWN